MVFEFDRATRLTWINQVTGEKWPEWKLWNDCTEEEKKQANLATPAKKYVVLDKDMKDSNEEQILGLYNEFKERLKRNNIEYFIGDRSPHGFHFFIPFKDLDTYGDEVILEIRKIFIEEFDCDLSKASLNGVISVPGRPHFKDGKTYPILDNIAMKDNILKNRVFEIAKSRIESKKERKVEQVIEIEFKDYFEKDPFWLFLNALDSPLPEGQGKNMTILKNLAIAASKSGKSSEEIQNLITPLIKKIMPDKSYNEFLGWYKKACTGVLNEYNLFEINAWTKTFHNRDAYDLKPILVTPEENIKDRKRIYTYKELLEMNLPETEWLVESWIPKGDFSILAGKSASFKSTILIHVCIGIVTGKPIFNKYKPIQGKVLYLNEENNKTNLMNIIKRCLKGYRLEDETKFYDSFHVSTYENFKLDKIEEIKFLIDYIQKHDISYLCLDSLRRFFSGKENEADVINQLNSHIKILQRNCPGLTITAIHHSKKGNEKEIDSRDMLRGSSDIVNGADSIIGINRRTGQNLIKIEQIKNRAGEEISNKILKLETGEQNDMFYFFETNINADGVVVKSIPEECAEKIMNYLTDNKIQIFARADLGDLTTTYPYDTITKALRILSTEGTLTTTGNKGHLKYVVNSTVENNDEDVENEKLPF